MPETTEDKKKKQAASSGGMSAGLSPNKIRIEDGRAVNAFGEPIKVGRTGDYDSAIVKQITQAAIKEGIDPMTALAVSMQESGLGTYKNFNAEQNYGQVLHGKWDSDPELQEEIKSRPDLNPEAVAMTHILKKGLDKKSGNEALDIQDYNGYLLKPNNDIGATKMYGIDLTKYPNGYDMKKDPRYGQSVIDIRDNVLKKNKSITGMVAGLMPTPENDAFKDISAAVVPSANGKLKLQYSKGGKPDREVEVDADAYNKAESRGAFLKQMYSANQQQKGGLANSLSGL